MPKSKSISKVGLMNILQASVFECPDAKVIRCAHAFGEAAARAVAHARPERARAFGGVLTPSEWWAEHAVMILRAEEATVRGGGRLFSRFDTYMTSAKFYNFFTPSPFPQTEFTQPSSCFLLFGDPLPPPTADVI